MIDAIGRPRGAEVGIAAAAHPKMPNTTFSVYTKTERFNETWCLRCP